MSTEFGGSGDHQINRIMDKRVTYCFRTPSVSQERDMRERSTRRRQVTPSRRSRRDSSSQRLLSPLLQCGHGGRARSPLRRTRNQDNRSRRTGSPGVTVLRRSRSSQRRSWCPTRRRDEDPDCSEDHRSSRRGSRDSRESGTAPSWVSRRSRSRAADRTHAARRHRSGLSTGRRGAQLPGSRESPSYNLSTNNDNNVTVSQLVQALQSVSNKNDNFETLSNRNTIPEFDPERKQQTIDMWLHKVNECSIIYNWTERQSTHFALQKLKGVAQKWYEGISTVLYTWLEWQEKLKLAFPSTENYGSLLSSMLGRRAKFNESLEEYFYEKIVLLNRCRIDGKRAVDCIVHGIDDRSVRLGAEAARFETPDQLLPYLKTVKPIFIQTDRKKSRNFNNQSDAVNKPEQKNRTVKCYNCSQEGHYKSQCTKPPVKCSRCLRYGHNVDRCTSTSTSLSTDGKVTKSVMCVTSNKMNVQ